MPQNPQVIIASTSLPTGFCPGSEQERLNEYARRLTGSLPGSYSTIVYQNAKPAVSDQDKLWVRINADGTLDRMYTFANGIWRSPHQIPPGFCMLYDGDITSIAGFDGGSVGTVTATTGPFWEEITAARGRFPVHPDPNKTLLTTAISVKGTGGEENHALIPGELPDHNHDIRGADTAILAGTGAANIFLGRNASITSVVQTTSSGGNNKVHNNMPPYYGAYLLRRTARLYYIVP